MDGSVLTERPLLTAAIGAAVALLVSLFALTRTKWFRDFTFRAADHESESFFRTKSGQAAFPSLFDAPSVKLSVVVPAYNESERITPMMDDMLAFLRSQTYSWEVIVVDDGSKDNTADFVYTKYAQAVGTDKFRVLKLYRNNGKGGAVRKGMMRARGEVLLMADADGATRTSDTTVLMRELEKVSRDGMGIAIGSRAHLEAAEGDATARRTPLRRLLMWGFHTFITIMLGGTDIKDTQCGFKMFTRAAARRIFPVQHVMRWAFDVELLFLAARRNIAVVEVPVDWHEVDGSKINIATAMFGMMRDITAVRVFYTIGVWSDAMDAGQEAAAAAAEPTATPTSTGEEAPKSETKSRSSRRRQA